MKLDIACGTDKKPGFMGVDNVKLPGVDYVMDVNKKLKFKDNSVDEIFSKNTLQHLKDAIFTITEFHRVLRFGGKLEIVVPHFTNVRAHNPFHKHEFSLHSLDYFDVNTEIGRDRAYYKNLKGARFVAVKREIKIRKNKWMPWIYLFERWINSSLRNMHLYETYFCYLWPAISLKFVLHKVNPKMNLNSYVLSSSYRKIKYNTNFHTR